MLSSGSASDLMLPSDKKTMAKSTERVISFILWMLLAWVVVLLELSVESPTNCSDYDTFLESLYPTEGATLLQDEVIHASAFVIFKDDEQNLCRKG